MKTLFTFILNSLLKIALYAIISILLLFPVITNIGALIGVSVISAVILTILNKIIVFIRGLNKYDFKFKLKQLLLNLIYILIVSGLIYIFIFNFNKLTLSLYFGFISNFIFEIIKQTVKFIKNNR
jgi:hypothetical protein